MTMPSKKWGMSQIRSTKTAAVAGLVFVSTLAVHLWHQIGLFQDKLTFLWDGQGYLETCQFATRILLALMRGDAATASSISSSVEFVKHIMNDGPVHTFAAASVFAILGRIPEYGDWQVFAILNALIQALSALLLFILTWEVTGAVWWSLGAALLFGIYPASIVASGRYLTEPYVVLCLLLFTFLATRTSIALKLFAGIFAGFVVLLKAVLAPAALIAAAVAGCFSSKGKRLETKRRALQILALFAGVLIALFPWFFFTKSATGTGLFYTPRTADYIACVSLDVGTDAWCTYPQSEFVTSMMAAKDPLSSRLIFIAEHIPELAAITIRKIGRLIAHPWNDPRLPVFGFISVEAQYFLHRCIIALALLGISVCLFKNRCSPYKRLKSQNRRLVLTCSLIFVAGHFLYLLTQAMGRNNYTMLPFVFLFSVLGMRAAVSFVLRSFSERSKQAQPQKRKQVLLGAAIAVMLAFFTWLICTTENLGLPWVGFEEKTIIKPGKSVEIAFDVSTLKRNKTDNTVFIFVDADKPVESADVFINDVPHGKGIVPIGRFCSDWYAQCRFLATHARVLRIPQSALRQWRAMPVPLNMVKLDGPNKLKLVNSGNQPITLFGACINRAFLPAPLALASDYMVNTADSLEMRVPQRIAPDGVSSSADKIPYGLSFVVASTSGERSSETSSALEIKPASTSKSLASIDLSKFPKDSLTPDGVLSISSRMAAKQGALIARVEIPEMPSGNHLNISVRGKAKLLSGDGRFGIKVSLERKNGQPLVPFNLPDHLIASGNEWNSFEIRDSIPMDFVDGRVTALSIELFPVPVSQGKYRTSTTEVLIKDLNVSAEIDSSIVVSGR